MAPGIREHIERMEVEELTERGFLLMGAVWWAVAFAGSFLTGHTEAAYAYGAVALFITAVLALGWKFERTAGVVLLVAAIACVAWGVTLGWTMPLWVLVGVTLIGELLIGSAMFFFEGHEETAIERIEHPGAARQTVFHAHA